MDNTHHRPITPPVTPPLENPLTGFRIHGIVFFATLLLLLFFDALSGETRWVHYVFFGWGIGLVAHGLAAGLKWSAQRNKSIV